MIYLHRLRLNLVSRYDRSSFRPRRFDGHWAEDGLRRAPQQRHQADKAEISRLFPHPRRFLAFKFPIKYRNFQVMAVPPTVIRNSSTVPSVTSSWNGRMSRSFSTSPFIHTQRLSTSRMWRRLWRDFWRIMKRNRWNKWSLEQKKIEIIKKWRFFNVLERVFRAVCQQIIDNKGDGSRGGGGQGLGKYFEGETTKTKSCQCEQPPAACLTRFWRLFLPNFFFF